LKTTDLVLQCALALSLLVLSPYARLAHASEQTPIDIVLPDSLFHGSEPGRSELRRTFQEGLSRALRHREFMAVDETTNVLTHRSGWVGKRRTYRNDFMLAYAGSFEPAAVQVEFVDYRVSHFNACGDGSSSGRTYDFRMRLRRPTRNRSAAPDTTIHVSCGPPALYQGSADFTRRYRTDPYAKKPAPPDECGYVAGVAIIRALNLSASSAPRRQYVWLGSGPPIGFAARPSPWAGLE
jgi:hypothetical protein